MNYVDKVIDGSGYTSKDLLRNLAAYSEWAHSQEWSVPPCLGETLELAEKVVKSLDGVMSDRGRIWYNTDGDTLPPPYSTVLLLLYGAEKSFCGYLDDGGEWYVWNRGLNYGNPMWWSYMPGDEGRGVLS